MKSEKKILIAFILNLAFSLFEFWGGIYTGSISVISDSIHDMGDAASIGLSFIFEKISKKKPDSTHTYGYARYSVLGGLVTNIILFFGSLAVIYNAVIRIIHPSPIKYNEMIVLAIIGVCVNFCAAYFTRGSDSPCQKAVNLHMIEDVLGWAIVLIAAVIMKFVNFTHIDPIMSVCVAVFILVNSIKNLNEIKDIFLEKTPREIDIEILKKDILNIENVIDVHQVRVHSIDGQTNVAAMHIVTDKNRLEIKKEIRLLLHKYNIFHVTLELESKGELCPEEYCAVQHAKKTEHHHHHHHHHHHK